MEESSRRAAAKREARIELARRSFWWYAKLKAPDFYREDRKYLEDFCNILQDFYISDDKVLVVNAPPRHGKSRTAQLFVEWVLGVDPAAKIMTGSYNEVLSKTFSKGVRDNISERKADEKIVVYSEVFPNNRIKRGDGAANLWSLEGHHNSYLATSPGGTSTGFGASLLIIDDLIKNADEAYNEQVLEDHWTWFANTMLSRLEKGGKIIVIMTRWHTKDLAGRILRHYTDIGAKIKHINLATPKEDGSMLCDSVLDRESYDLIAKVMGEDIVAANYGQTPIDIKGRLYSGFKTYDDIPRDENGNPLFVEIRNYTDTADRGDDYLCSITYGVYDMEAYVLDVIYTKDAMEITEPLVAQTLYDHSVIWADIESNNGGRGFGRSVENILLTQHKTNKIHVNLFHQSKNKQARIISNSTWCMKHVYFPTNWRDRWSDFYTALYEYQKEGKNKHDDAPDALSGICDKIGRGAVFSFD